MSSKTWSTLGSARAVATWSRPSCEQQVLSGPKLKEVAVLQRYGQTGTILEKSMRKRYNMCQRRGFLCAFCVPTPWYSRQTVDYLGGKPKHGHTILECAGCVSIFQLFAHGLHIFSSSCTLQLHYVTAEQGLFSGRKVSINMARITMTASRWVSTCRGIPTGSSQIRVVVAMLGMQSPATGYIATAAACVKWRTTLVRVSGQTVNRP